MKFFWVPCALPSAEWLGRSGENSDRDTEFDSESVGFRPTHVRIRATLGKLPHLLYLSFLTCKNGEKDSLSLTGWPRGLLFGERVHTEVLGRCNMHSINGTIMFPLTLKQGEAPGIAGVHHQDHRQFRRGGSSGVVRGTRSKAQLTQEPGCRSSSALLLLYKDQE